MIWETVWFCSLDHTQNTTMADIMETLGLHMKVACNPVECLCFGVWNAGDCKYKVVRHEELKAQHNTKTCAVNIRGMA